LRKFIPSSAFEAGKAEKDSAYIATLSQVLSPAGCSIFVLFHTNPKFCYCMFGGILPENASFAQSTKHSLLYCSSIAWVCLSDKH